MKGAFYTDPTSILVNRFYVGGPPNIPVENSFLNASPYYQLSFKTYFKVLNAKFCQVRQKILDSI